MLGSLFALASALSYSLVAISVRKGIRPADRTHGVFIGLLVNVVLLGLAYVSKLAIGGEAAPLTAAGIAWFGAAGFTTGWLAREALYRGIRHIGPGRTAAIKNLNPFVAVVLAVAFLGDRFSTVGVVGAAVALSGYVILVSEQLRQASNGAASSAPELPAGRMLASTEASASVSSRSAQLLAGRHTGYVVASLAALAFGVGQIFRGLGIDQVPDPYLGALIAAVVAIVAFLCFGAVTGTVGAELRSVVHSPRPFLWLAGAASALGNLTFFMALSHASVSHVSIIAASDTLLTVLLAAVLFKSTDRVTAALGVAAVAVFSGTVLLTFG